MISFSLTQAVVPASVGYSLSEGLAAGSSDSGC
jgi:hypothetical protein